MPIFQPAAKRVPAAMLNLSTIFTLTIAFLTFGCNGNSGGSSSGGGSSSTPTTSTANEWTWGGGSNTGGVVPVDGTQRVASPSNTPEGRSYSVSWTDKSGNLWLFGGWGGGFDPTVGAFGDLNDLCEFNPRTKEWTWVSGSSTGGIFNPTTKEWRWVSGSNTGGVVPVYGTRGVASASNTPGGRDSAASWIDSSGNFWLFGGFDYDTVNGATGTDEYLNDLWEFNPTTKEWTWVSGSNTAGVVPVYGTQGVASTSNTPGGRDSAASWTDSSGNFWLFGGVGYDSNGDLNDLWEFNPTAKEWTWVSGSNTGGVVPVYGTRGVASTSNTPGGRDSAASWTDSSGNFWLFGGNDYLNDLWEFNPATKEWTWVSGSNTRGASGLYGTLGVYGTQGVAAASNAPGARESSVSWTDSSGNFWLFGGVGYDSTGVLGELNDLWEFNPATKEWTWVSGSNTIGVVPVYGTRGVASASNTPGGRYGSTSWIDGSGNFWLFGGDEYLDDLWEFNPTTKEWTWVSGGNTRGVSGVYGAPPVLELPH